MSLNRIYSWLAGICLFTAAAPAAAQSPWRFEDVERFVAVADIHGAYDSFERVLTQAGLIDEAHNWTGGTDHLIIVGDVLDRGPASRQALDLIMQLEQAAPAAGGAVQFVLGNHELMNLVGDLRYVSAAEYAAFAHDESAEVRAAARELFDGTQQAFEARFPPGFFAHRAAFSPAGRYGAWLLQRPVMAVVNDWAFVHGGIAASSGTLLTDSLNQTLQQQLYSYTVALHTLTRLGVLQPDAIFYDHPQLIEAFAQQVTAGETSWSEAAETAANIVLDLNGAFVFDANSPTWYRGNVGCSPLVERDRLAALLESAGVRQLVVGHTPTRDYSIHSRLDRTVYRVDTGMLSQHYGGRGAALVVEGALATAIYESSSGPQAIAPQPRRVGYRPPQMSADDLLAFLASAEITRVTKANQRWQTIELSDGATTLSAAFTPAASRGALPDLAAWRLDQLLGLEMVPATVSREVNGEPGTLQYLPALAMNEQQRQIQRAGGGAWCPLPDQFGAMYIFDALIGNAGRSLERLLYNTESFQIVLVGHDAAFTTTGSKPDHLSEIALPLTPMWVELLVAMSEESLQELLGDVLDRRRLRALLARRDAILEDAGIAP